MLLCISIYIIYGGYLSIYNECVGASRYIYYIYGVYWGLDNVDLDMYNIYAAYLRVYDVCCVSRYTVCIIYIVCIRVYI